MKNKGFTVIELVLTISLVSVVMIILFQIIFLVKNLYVESGVKVKLLQKQLVISEKINNDFAYKDLLLAKRCGNSCVEFDFSDGTNKKIEYDREEKTIKYGNFKTALIGDSTFGNIIVKTEKVMMMPYNQSDSLLIIEIPIYNPFFEGENFGLKIIYQYNSDNTAIDGVYLDDIIEENKRIYLIGGTEYTIYSTMTYGDPGFYLVNDNGELLKNDDNVIVTGTVLEEPGTYEITYIYKDSFGNIIDTVIRNVNVIAGINDFDYEEECETYNIPIDGLYKLEVWGAEGGSTTIYDLGGRGAYTVGYQYFSKNTVLYICVGGLGKPGSTIDVLGGFNGGGMSVGGSSRAGGSGGGATDIRLSESFTDTIIVAGGGGGSGSNNSSSSLSTGGAGGGGAGIYSTTSYNGQGGTEESGGLAASYTTSVTRLQTEGISLHGGNSGLYSTTYSGGAGGGGYFGGGGGVRYGPGGGGSSYCEYLVSCKKYDGTVTITLPDNTTSTGKSGDGYARITLASILN